MTLVPTEGSILSMSPASGVVEFTYNGETWSEPMIGWASVVGWRSLDDPPGTSSPRLADNDIEYDSSIEPVILEDGEYPVTLRQYRQQRELGPSCMTKLQLG